MTEALTKSNTEVLSANSDFSEYMADLPESMEECIKLITRDFLEAARISTLRFWRIGRIIDTLKKRKEPNVIETIRERTGYEKRTIFYAASLYEKCPNFEFLLSVCNSGKVEWSDVKLILPVEGEQVRENLMIKLAEGELDKSELKAEVKRIKDQEKEAKELKEHTPKQKGSEDPVKDKISGKDMAYSPKRYFEIMCDKFRGMLESHNNYIVDLADYYALMLDETRTSDDEYNAARKEIRRVVNQCNTLAETFTKFAQDQQQALTDMG